MISRYLRTDPLGIDGGLNLYVYAMNSPLMFTDPDGLIARATWDLYETPPSKKGIVSRWFMAFCPTTLSLPLQVEGIKSIKLLSLLGKN
nr:RHS repeat-associated core domain-containing protein [uncultured Desulfobacter sp.]